MVGGGAFNDYYTIRIRIYNIYYVHVRYTGCFSVRHVAVVYNNKNKTKGDEGDGETARGQTTTAQYIYICICNIVLYYCTAAAVDPFAVFCICSWPTQPPLQPYNIVYDAPPRPRARVYTYIHTYMYVYHHTGDGRTSTDARVQYVVGLIIIRNTKEFKTCLKTLYTFLVGPILEPSSALRNPTRIGPVESFERVRRKRVLRLDIRENCIMVT